MVGVIRFRGHFPKGGYDVPDGSRHHERAAVAPTLEDGKSIAAVASDLDLTASVLGRWVAHARADHTKGRTGLTTVEREELARLRKENRVLREERDILKKAAAFFAKQPR